MTRKIDYTADGYINMKALLNKERFPFIFITGARGAGKTYGALDYMIRQQHAPFILMRRTQVQADFAGNIATTPLVANLRDDEYLVQVKTNVKNLYRIDVMNADKLINTCFILALSTVSSMRGISLMSCDYIVFDEFIKEPHERPIRSEFEAFKSAYETINRNREQEQRRPLTVVALSNALDLANPYYRGLEIVNQVYAMRDEVYRDAKQGVAVYRPLSEAFTARKAQTALYQLSGAERTLGNEWQDVDTSRVKSLSLKTAAPVCTIDTVGFFRVHGALFASSQAATGRPAYSLDDRADRVQVHRKAQGVVSKLLAKDVTYESVDVMLRCSEIIARL